MSQGRLRAVWQITSEAIDELHRSLESRPGETAVAEDRSYSITSLVLPFFFLKNLSIPLAAVIVLVIFLAYP